MEELNTSRLTETLDILTHPYRRYVLYYLANESEGVSIDTLTFEIAKWDGVKTRTDRNNGSNDIKTGLRHMHLPRMADAGIILFGANMDSVELRETDGLDRFLDVMARIDGYVQTAAGD